MEYLLYVGIILWFGYWSSESGASFPWSAKWQRLVGFFSEVPEFILALSVGAVAVLCWPVEGWWMLAVGVISTVIAYAGKQSATWGLLPDKWDGYNVGDKGVTETPSFDDYRDNTMTPIVVWIMKRLGFKATSPALAWIWSANKGLLMTLPVGGTGLITHPIGQWIGWKLGFRYFTGKGRNAFKEFMGGAFGIGIPCVILLMVF